MVREVVCLVLELREEKLTFVKVGGEKVDFFFLLLASVWQGDACSLV